jgi:hypothetical protein
VFSFVLLDALDRALELDAVKIHIASTAKANDAADTAHAKDAEATLAAGVGLFELHDHIRLQFKYLHGVLPCLYYVKYNIK